MKPNTNTHKPNTNERGRHDGQGRRCKRRARMVESQSGSHDGRFGAGRGSHRDDGYSGGWGEEFGEGPGGGRRSGGRHGGGHGTSHGGGHGRSRGGRGRMFGSGELRLLLLKLVADESRHGYELIKAIEELTGGNYAPSPGIVYPTLSLLVDEGMLEQVGESAARKAFAATEAGRAELGERTEAADALIARLRGLADAGERQDSPPLRRAVGNLFAALRNRTGAGNIEAETVHAIVDVLDDAARRIERL